MAQKLGIPKGTRDFNSEQIFRRSYIIDHVKRHFENFGFQPIETPSFEKISTLTGKYGAEGDRLIFKILNSGDFLKKVSDDLLLSRDIPSISSRISEKALRYDLTVPFARYVVQHQSELVFPFKRFQIQPVWRADRPQKGRFREFYQCDADVVGSDSLWQDVELVLLYDAVFSDLKIPTRIKINNRKILSGLSELLLEKNKFTDFIIALDKLDKIGKDAVIEEMKLKGISDASVQNIEIIFDTVDSNDEKIRLLENILSSSEVGRKGLDELRFVFNRLKNVGLKSADIELDLTLARGLNYYTGSIFEVLAKNVRMGSIGGGGRYDNLTEIFGLKNMSGVGISFGLDRIYIVMDELNLFDEMEMPKPKILFINFGEKEALYSLKAVNVLRAQGVKAELYPDAGRLKKQMNYANKRNIPFVAMAGSQEMEKGVFSLKNMQTGEQKTLGIDELVKNLQE